MVRELITQFEALDDPRCDRKIEHKLVDVLVIAVCAVLAEAESFEDIALYGRCKRLWLEQFLALPNGIPSHDTFRRVLMLIDPDAFERCFLAGCGRCSDPTRAHHGGWRSTARWCGAPLIAGAVARPCTWSAPMRPSTGSCWPSARPRPEAASWRPYPSCSTASISGAAW